ncbi:MAG: DsbA family protein [Pseudomonadota bacterium]
MNRWIAGGALAGAAGLTALAFSGLTSGIAQTDEGGSGFSNAEKGEIERIVADYIANNPEKVMEALTAFAAAEDERRAADQRVAQREAATYLASAEDAYEAGPDASAAKVAVVEFFDYHCGFCKRANGLVRELTSEDPSVKVVFRELPILRQESEIAARHALAARAQGKYLDFHFALMKKSGTLTEARILKVAKDIGLDVERLKKDAQSDSVEDALEYNYQVAKDIGVDGTPGFLVVSTDGSFVELIPGFRPEEIRKAVKEAKKASS